MAPNAFTLLLDRAVPGGRARQAAWSPAMDVLALLLDSGAVVLVRLSWQWVGGLRPDRLVPGERGCALAWSPDGRQLAVGLTDGRIILYGVEGGTAQQVIAAAAPDVGAVVRLVWAAAETVRESILLAAYEHDSAVHLWVRGFFYGIRISVPGGAVNSMALSPDARRLVVCTEAPAVFALDTGWPADAVTRWDALAGAHQAVLSMAYGCRQWAHRVCQLWEGAQRALEEALASLTATLQRHHSRSELPASTAHEELLLLARGLALSPPLQDWFAQDMSTDAVRRLGKELLAGLNDASRGLAAQVMPRADALLSQVGGLRATPEVLASAKQVVLRSQRAYVLLRRVRSLYVALCGWLMGHADEQVQAPVDNAKVLSCLQEEHLFRTQVGDALDELQTACQRLPLQARRFFQQRREAMAGCPRDGHGGASPPPPDLGGGFGHSGWKAARVAANAPAVDGGGSAFFVVSDTLQVLRLDAHSPPNAVQALNLPIPHKDTAAGAVRDWEVYRDGQVCVLTDTALGVLSVSNSQLARWRPLPPAIIGAGAFLASSAARGLAAVFPTAARVLFLDLEEDDDDEEDRAPFEGDRHL
ncbi:hypothetical protein CDCA_CDCA06G1998 [Cyanidium caldarium]|uniref:Anaphase-promoting complex subunit 4 n=1 Tax=Cyanidium caldarium TaxID=2771 RepID=A0AAV9IV67_CYACA|nr:hypothetical protein CDCA_CDCA06G1998 [Cyanidium caldarium]